ncbi:Protein of unknown function [Austwickia chelonae]|nr:DUF2975 domain-containing protein [Austwickia chelonae]SEW39342.1 Protein of unknown function [Austwickia chelonae]
MMLKIRSIILRFSLVFGVAFTLIIQVVALPYLAEDSAQQFPEVSFLKIPILTLSVMQLACFQVALIAIWRLCSLVQSSDIFEEGSLKWMTIIQGSAAAAFALTLVEFAFFALNSLGPLGVPLAGIALLVFLAGFMALVSTLKSLLQIAISDRAKMMSVV